MTTDYLPIYEYKKLFPYLSYENYLCLRISLETGLRIGDVVALPAAALKGCEISYTAQKTGKNGTAKITTDLADKLQKISGSSFIFESCSKSGHRTRQAVWKDVKQAAHLAGVRGNIAPHSARKTHAVKTFRTKGLAATQRELQHDNPATTLTYAFSDIMSGAREAAAFGDMELLADMIAEKVVEKLKKS